MPRPKKEGRKVSFYMQSEVADKLEKYCKEVGQTKTLAVERIINAHIDDYEGKREKK